MEFGMETYAKLLEEADRREKKGQTLDKTNEAGSYSFCVWCPLT